MQQVIKIHPLATTLIELKGPPKVLVLTEPMWQIPYNLYVPFATVYMYALGVRDAQIGLLISLGMVLQVLTSLAGGVIVDKLGRRRTLLIFDLVAWVVACVLLAFARNIWWFLAAAVVNAFYAVSGTAWGCLLAEETPKDRIRHVYTLIHAVGRIAMFFTPLTALLVNRFGVVPAIRAVYGIAAVVMCAKFVITFVLVPETAFGKARMRDTKDQSSATLMLGYKGVIRDVTKSGTLVRIFLLTALWLIMNTVLANFFALYATQDLGIGEGWLAGFPMMKAAIVLVVFFTGWRLAERESVKAPMLVGLALYVLSHGALIAATGSRNLWLVAHILCEAVAFGLFLPRLDTLIALGMDPTERAKLYSVLSVIALAVSSPLGAVAGLLSQADRRLPFAMNILVVVLMGCLIATGFNKPAARQNQ